jgi:hypothetical protein
MQELITILSWTGSLIGISISIVIFFLKRSNRHHRLLATYLFLLTGCLAEPILSGYLSPENHFLLLFGTMNFLIGPVLYFYCRSQVSLFKNKSRYIPHFIPFIIYTLLIIFYTPIKTITSPTEMELLELTFYELFFIQFFIYGFRSLRIIRYEKTNEPIPKVTNTFLKVLVTTSLLIFLTSFLVSHFYLLSGIQQALSFHLVIQILLMFSLALFILLNPESIHPDKLVPMD